MDAATVVGRLGPLAAALGAGLVLGLFGAGAGVAVADSADSPDHASQRSADRSAAHAAARSPAGRSTRIAAGPSARQHHDRVARSAGSTATTRPAGPVARAGVVSWLGALLNNQTPRMSPAQTSQDSGGVVRGVLNAVDPDSPRLGFAVVEDPAHGTVRVSDQGQWVYTAGEAVAVAGVSDSFRVSVSDAPSGFAIHGLAGLVHLLTFGLLGSRGDSSTATVAVTVVPFAAGNGAPTGVFALRGTDPVTGVVTGVVSGSDPDGDALSYSGPAATAKGTLIVDAAGAVTYTPTAEARATAAAPGAVPADRADAFTVTVSDGRGGTALVVVEVPVIPASAPVNRAPTATVRVGDPDPVSGVVTGAVNGSDPDGDLLSYSLTAAPARGAVVLGGDGAFTYTPTPVARATAGAPGATPADRADAFTVTVIDGRGGTTTAAVTVTIAPTPPTPAGPPAAFPGAEGFGAAATGGRDGSVVYVTNLNTSGPGSLQWAIDQPGARYVLFKVSGVIDARIHLTNGDVTIAGQTSPGGITVRGFVTDETPFQDQAVRAPTDFAENWILQHIRIRPGADGPSDDGLRLRYTRNAIVDHVSIGNATDEAIEISYSNNITVQNTIIAETVGGHSFFGGVLMNYSNPAHGFALDNVSLHHNVFNRIEGRLPEGSRESPAAAGSFMNLELSNNLYWDPNFFIALGADTGVAGGQPIYWNLNAVNNYFQTRADFPYAMFDDQILRVAGNQLYVSGNRMNLYPSRSDYQLFYCCNDYRSTTDPATGSGSAQARSVRHPFPAITYTPTDQLRATLLATAGAWPRDPMDTRLMDSVASNSIASGARNVNPAGDALLPAFTGTAPAAPADTDNDGMPDSWEISKGLNPAVANTNARTLSPAGYTDLEVYLHELSASRVGG